MGVMPLRSIMNVARTLSILREVDGQTSMHFHQAIFESVASRDGHEGGWNESFDRLETWLAEARS